MRRLLPLTLLVAGLPAFAQAIDSHQVNANGSITFRYQNSGAAKVEVDTDAAMDPLPMQRDSTGLWSVTTAPLPPEHYGYDFVVDGVEQLDPLNHTIRPNLVGLYSDVLVPGHPPAPWELTEIPHGDITRYTFTTHIARHLPMNQESYLVYTPPGYDPKHKGGYPVLYLLHGWSDTETGWDDVGQANLILDSLLATGKIVPMIVVMPEGYGDFDFVTKPHDVVWGSPAMIDENVALYTRMLLLEVVPAVEHEYNIAHGRENHAIAGLSMGGLESLTIGINHADEFAWVGGFSAAIQHEHFDEHMPDAKSARDLRLLWVACGTGDEPHIAGNRDFILWAKSKRLPVTAVETGGKHTWLVWRDNLVHFAPLLFR